MGHRAVVVAILAAATPVSADTPPAGSLVAEVSLQAGLRIVGNDGTYAARDRVRVSWQLGIDGQLPASRWNLGGAFLVSAIDDGAARSQTGLVARAGLRLGGEWSLRLGLGICANSSDLTAGFRDTFPSGLVRVGVEHDVGFAIDLEVQTNDTGGGDQRSAPVAFMGMTSTGPLPTLAISGAGATIGLIALAVLLSRPMHE